jgi:hypothetical protein
VDTNAASLVEDKLISTGTVSSRRVSDDSVKQMPRKTFVQDLSIWSGMPRTNLFKMFIRYVVQSTWDCALDTDIIAAPFP